MIKNSIKLILVNVCIIHFMVFLRVSSSFNHGNALHACWSTGGVLCMGELVAWNKLYILQHLSGISQLLFILYMQTNIFFTK